MEVVEFLVSLVCGKWFDTEQESHSRAKHYATAKKNARSSGKTKQNEQINKHTNGAQCAA